MIGRDTKKPLGMQLFLWSPECLCAMIGDDLSDPPDIAIVMIIALLIILAILNG